MEIIGKGTYGKVFVTREHPNTVVKIIDARLASIVENHDDLLALSKHEHIAKVLDVLLVDEELHILMNRYKIDLGRLVRNKNRPLNLELTLRCEAQIGTALEFLHSEWRILHADVKPDNILIDGNMNFFLCDFSISLHLDKDKLTCCNQIYSEPYRPPILFYNMHIPNGNTLHEEYDFFALFLTLCFAYLGEKFGEILQSDYEYIRRCENFRWRTFPQLMKRKFKDFKFIDNYFQAFLMSF